ncbi:MAG: hypothetical protein ACU84Q_14855 [Gammaproteobacteria bacterium]
MPNIFSGFFISQRPKLGNNSDTLRWLWQITLLEFFVEFRLANKHQLKVGTTTGIFDVTDDCPNGQRKCAHREIICIVMAGIVWRMSLVSDSV